MSVVVGIVPTSSDGYPFIGHFSDTTASFMLR